MIASVPTSRPLTRFQPLARDLLIAMLAGLGVAAAKRFLDFHLGIPGHSGTFWVAAMLIGTAAGRPGTGVMAGLSVGLWGVPLGLGHSMGYNALLYASAGGALDLARWSRVLRLSNPLGAATAGFVIHMTKLAFVIVYAGAIGMVKNIHLLGIAPVAFNHAIFGIAGGLLAWTVLRAARRR